MERMIRIVNTFAAALFLVTMLISAIFLMAGRDGFGAGAPGRWVPAGWTGLFALLAALAFVNLRAAGRDGAGPIALNAAAALPMIAGAALIDGARLLCAVCALPFALTALLLAARPSSLSIS